MNRVQQRTDRATTGIAKSRNSVTPVPPSGENPKSCSIKSILASSPRTSRPVLIVVVLARTTIISAPFTTTLVMAAIAGTLLAVITAVLAATLIPNGVGHDIQCFDCIILVVAGDNEIYGLSLHDARCA